MAELIAFGPDASRSASNAVTAIGALLAKRFGLNIFFSCLFSMKENWVKGGDCSNRKNFSFP
ncbi:MAG: hypothetical protein AAGI03_11070 [Pseudomonadota bacterium]